LSRRLSTVLSLFACLLGVNLSLWGQSPNAVQRIPGYLDPRTGEFHMMPQSARSEPEPDATTPTTCTASPCTGTYAVTFTITVDSTLAATDEISCNVSASVLDDGGLNAVIDSASVGVARGSGKTVTCTVNIPYSWNLLSPTTDTVRLGYVINAPAEPASASALLPSRTSSQQVNKPGTTLMVPISGATTKFTVDATI
jgi:hypothetical protein